MRGRNVVLYPEEEAKQSDGRDSYGSETFAGHHCSVPVLPIEQPGSRRGPLLKLSLGM